MIAGVNNKVKMKNTKAIGVKPITCRYGNGQYIANTIVSQKRADYISKNKTHFIGIPDEKRKQMLGELWDIAYDAVNPEKADNKAETTLPVANTEADKHNK